ncbi:hypothetical protein [Psychromonas sp. KJ10-2]|uniref:hypothetical protein n=1 Tax=Psychromonas sp. KJ10-2 TaxID=3391822 RepID=UPI0039B55E90
MEIPLINKLITTNGFGLRSWDDRYSKGVRVCVAPNSYMLEEVESASDDGDLDMIPSTEFLLSQDWLPFAIGKDFIHALQELENRLNALPVEQIDRASNWSNSVHEVLEHLKEVASSGNNNFKELSNNFEKTWI